MAPAMATARLRKEVIKLQTAPPPGVIAEPDESNILKWHYAIQGPPDSVFEGGTYIGKLVFPTEYPMKPPGILMLTPSGRFVVNTRLCLSMSDFHPESWHPVWSVATIIQGVQSFMTSEELTTGGVKSTDAKRKEFAASSMDYNRKMFPTLFGGDLEAAFAEADQARVAAEAKAVAEAKSADATSTVTRRGRGRRNKTNTAESTTTESEVTKEDKTNADSEQQQPQKELTPEDIEKRRKRNAKKRAKQKAKKGPNQEGDAEAATDGEE